MTKWRRVVLLLLIGLCVPAAAAAQWESPTRAFHKDTSFPLEGKHLAVACASCHLNGVTKGTPTTCFGCHWQRRQDDRYRLRLGASCEQCHKATTWTDTLWNHGAVTGTPIGAPHATLECTSCHTGGRFDPAAMRCVTCHQKDYDTTSTPNHRTAGFPTTCDTCHRPSDVAFSVARFDHDSAFALIGVHRTQTCASCHTASTYKGTPRDCVGCHRDDYDRTTAPVHTSAGFPTTCDSCHQPTDPAWTRGSATFNHAEVFALTGRHAVQACSACHTNGRYAGTPRDCVGCHRTTYDRTTAPNHAAAGYATACESCHSPTATSWAGAQVNHEQFFPLLGRHSMTNCASCHTGGTYKGTPRECYPCHRSQYERTSRPNHAAAGYTTSCEACHSASAATWAGAAVNHNQFFPLLGRHSTTDCASCHSGGTYKGTPRECYPCHRTQFERTTRPNHAAAGFSIQCEPCHKAGDAAWTGVPFNHDAFALVGQHATATCASCHASGVYKGTPRDCVGCHLSAYERTTDPNHAAAGFPTTCETCHRAADASWDDGRFTHTWFPITSGPHLAPCATCHPNGSNFREFTCLTCHTRTETDNEHKERPGYVYNSVACYSCHPNGKS